MGARMILSIIVVLGGASWTMSMELCADGTQRYPNKTCNLKDSDSCPNTYRCRKISKGEKTGECCRYKKFRDCNALMQDLYTPRRCRGGGSEPCPSTHECEKVQGNFYSMCCPKNVTCIDEVGIEHKPTDKSWKSNYDKCNKCKCQEDGTIKCTNKPKCSKCLIDGKHFSRGDIYWQNCKRCKCISGKHSEGACEGACESGTIGDSSTYSPHNTKNGGCIHQVRVSQCYNSQQKEEENGQHCLDIVEPKLEFKESLDHKGACPKAGTRITESGTIITGGNEVKPKYNYRWMVYIKSDKGSICGGSILTPRHILTAAHCLFSALGIQFTTIEVQTGKHNITVVEPFQQNRTINITLDKVHIHEYFNLSNYINDIAILVVDPPLEFNHVTQPILLPRSHFKNDITKELCGVIGWGKYSDEALFNPYHTFAKRSNVLLEAEMSDLTCDLPKADLAVVTKHSDAMFCASNFGKKKLKNPQDSCGGDSGGPLMCRNGKLWTQYGIVSWGSPGQCGLYSGVYTKVATYTDWINDKITYNGNWSDFGSFTPCSTTCGPGKKSRVRICSNPVPIGLGTCVGELGKINIDKKTGHITDVETVDCDNIPCLN